jgi:CDP-6-deoxy-D-xylo-4-hexulose-3-dehydrase
MKIMSNSKWSLMENTITFSDRLKMALFVLTNDRLTNGPKVKQFESEWSKWLGVDHSLYVSSGSTANSLLIAAVKELYGLKDGDKVLVPVTTWMTNIAPIIQNGMQPIFCDINLQNFSFDIDELKYIASQHSDIKVIFITHLIGLSSDVEKVREIFPNAIILEDICESHGVEGPNGKKRGTDSVGSTFSFYFGHHMTTIEGGIVSTNNAELYELMRMKRSHGMAREASPHLYEKYAKENPDIDKMFLFMTDGYNFRNHEICAVLGLSQIKRLDKNIEIRKQNFEYWRSKILNSSKYFVPQDQKGNSSFCFPIISVDQSLIKSIKNTLNFENIEYRPIISGNILRHPAFRKYNLCTKKENPNVEILHNNGLYVGNSQFVTKKKIDRLISIMGV